ncbi:MAG TPA: isochorismatase family protein [Acidimicrobiia bacterium]|nr:isochorismatase family protein [Acidimicrobiia bacterium]
MISYDTTTALVIVDVQNDFADPDGSLFVEGAESVVPRVNIEIMRAQSAGAFVAYSQDWHPASAPEMATDGTARPVHCVQDTWGAELHPGLEVAGPVVRRGARGEDGYSAFTMRDPDTGEDVATPLHAMLEEMDVQRVVVVGLTLEDAVKATALESARKYITSVVSEACVAIDREPGDGRRAIQEMRDAGVTID